MERPRGPMRGVIVASDLREGGGRGVPAEDGAGLGELSDEGWLELKPIIDQYSRDVGIDLSDQEGQVHQVAPLLYGPYGGTYAFD